MPSITKPMRSYAPRANNRDHTMSVCMSLAERAEIDAFAKIAVTGKTISASFSARRLIGIGVALQDSYPEVFTRLHAEVAEKLGKAA
ncbi:hypothetical protein [Pandoraea fibrosis]|uniref:Uncharacterized protein n=1 Tax=Pandoraea fibrosis TaxID=1891094 RepID=A0A5E4SWF8_9BURK|nr:hypothetical protein [Pandoraea fibrosis]VVD78139.1 hypothetical protein PFI31113_00966 [Pandoraea fibrosis]